MKRYYYNDDNIYYVFIYVDKASCRWFLWHEVLVLMGLLEGSASSSLCPGWEGSATIFPASLRVLEDWQIAANHSNNNQLVTVFKFESMNYSFVCTNLFFFLSMMPAILCRKEDFDSYFFFKHFDLHQQIAELTTNATWKIPVNAAIYDNDVTVDWHEQGAYNQNIRTEEAEQQ